MYKKVRSKAPLRLGLAGGGTDVSPYSERHGGLVLNATINLYAYCTIELRNDNKIKFVASDINETWEGLVNQCLELSGPLILHRAIYNRVVRDFNDSKPLAITLTTFSDVPPGCGLGSSSTMTVAIIAAYLKLLKVYLCEYKIAHLAFEIERLECNLTGGKQDQYAASFGGFNFMEFSNEEVLVNPLRIKENTINELESHLLLYYTGRSRNSSEIIKEQIKHTNHGEHHALHAMHEVKQSANKIKEALLKFNIQTICNEIHNSWLAKKKTSIQITNQLIEDIFKTSMASGALACKISGAGGGGFMMILVTPEKKLDVIKSLRTFDGSHYFVSFEMKGVQSWIVE